MSKGTQDSRLKTQDSRLGSQTQKSAFGVPLKWSVVCSLWSVVFGLLLVGCAEQQIPEDRRQKSELRVEHRVSSIEYRVSSIEEVMQIAEDVLAKMHFTIEKADAESGLVRTRPLPGAQFFEFWRSDNVGAFNYAEANLHSTRRVVELDISQKDGTVCIGCDVKVYRLSLPEHYVSSSARAYEMFSESSSLLQIIKLNPEQEAAMAWVNLGSDRQLETEILKRIENRLTAENTKNAENIG